MNKIIAALFVVLVVFSSTISAQNACDCGSVKPVATTIARGARGPEGPMGPAGPAGIPGQIPQWMYYAVGASLLFGFLGMILGIAGLTRQPYVVHPAPVVINNAPPAPNLHQV